MFSEVLSSCLVSDSSRLCPEFFYSVLTTMLFFWAFKSFFSCFPDITFCIWAIAIFAGTSCIFVPLRGFRSPRLSASVRKQKRPAPQFSLRASSFWRQVSSAEGAKTRKQGACRGLLRSSITASEDGGRRRLRKLITNWPSWHIIHFTHGSLQLLRSNEKEITDQINMVKKFWLFNG